MNKHRAICNATLTLVLLLMISGVPVRAQVLRPTQADTIRAVKRLFGSRRAGAWTGIGFAAATIATPVLIGAATASPGRAVNSDAYVGAGFVVSLPIWGVALRKWSRFSANQERQVLRQYEESRLLPPYVRRKLHRRFFRP